MASGYRDRPSALFERRCRHRQRIGQLDGEAKGRSRRRLDRRARRRLQELRHQAEPEDDSVAALVAAEGAADDYERLLDESLGLGAELRKSVRPILPPREVWLRWAGFAAVSLSVLLLGVHEFGMGDFMLRALGVRVLRLDAGVSAEALGHAHVLLHDAEADKAAPRSFDALRVELIVSRRSPPHKR
jgi:hypothetical protein